MFMCVTLILLAIIALLVYLYFTWNFNYWKKNGVVGPKPHFFVGNFPSTFRGDKNIVYDFEELYRKYKNKQRYIGVFAGREPQLLILSPDVVHDVYVTKFRNFYDNHAGHIYRDEYDKIFGLNPFFLKGQEWKNKRAEITPALSLNRIKASYPVMQKVGTKLVDFIKDQIRVHGKDYDFNVKDVCQRFTVQNVADCVFGVDAQALSSNSESEILNKARALIVDFMSAFNKLFFYSMVPFMPKFFHIEFISKNVRTFFKNLMHDALNMRKQNRDDRVDFLNYIIEQRQKKGFTEVEMLSHFFSFLGDGFETSASALMNTLLCLGRNPKIQAELRQEIESNCGEDGTISFEKLHDLPLLNGCFYETMRIFPVLGNVYKVCTEETTCENYDGSSVTVQKGTIINLPTLCFHMDEAYFPDPDQFLPERFFEENGGEKKYRDMGVYAPFGDGPRMCLGQKFGIAQVKTGLLEIVRNFEITVSEKTRKDNLLSPNDVLSNLEGGVWLQFKELKN